MRTSSETKLLVWLLAKSMHRGRRAACDVAGALYRSAAMCRIERLCLRPPCVRFVAHCSVATRRPRLTSDDAVHESRKSWSHCNVTHEPPDCANVFKHI